MCSLTVTHCVSDIGVLHCLWVTFLQDLARSSYFYEYNYEEFGKYSYHTGELLECMQTVLQLTIIIHIDLFYNRCTRVYLFHMPLTNRPIILITNLL